MAVEHWPNRATYEAAVWLSERERETVAVVAGCLAESRSTDAVAASLQRLAEEKGFANGHGADWPCIATQWEDVVRDLWH